MCVLIKGRWEERAPKGDLNGTSPSEQTCMVPQVSQGVSCPGWGLILDLIIYEWTLVLTSDFPLDDGAQVTSRLCGLSAAGRHH